MSNGDLVLEVENLRTEFHLRSGTVGAVDGVSFAVGAGECVGLVGESGCGKSTTGLSIMKLLPPVGHVVGGSIKLLGRDLGPLSESEMRDVRGNDAAMIFQDPMTSLNPTWTVGDQIAEAYRLHHDCSQAEALARAREVLELVGLPRPAERLSAYPHQLSGGLRQRVMIAMALVNSPKLLIADEPTTALDVTIQAQILDLIDGLRKRPRDGGHPHHARPRRHRRARKSRDGHVRGEDRGGRRHGGAVRVDAPPVHRGAVPVDPALRPGSLAGALLDPGRAAGSHDAAARLPLRGALPQRAGALHAGGAASRPETSDGSRPGAGVEHTETPAPRTRSAPASTSSHASTRSRRARRRSRPVDHRHRARAGRARRRAGRERRRAALAPERRQGVPRHRRCRLPTEDRHRQGRLRRLLRRSPRRDVRARRRVGLREDDDRLARRGAPAADLGPDPLRRPGHGDAPRRRPAPGQTRLAADVPGPVRVARPAHARRPVDQGAARRSSRSAAAPSGRSASRTSSTRSACHRSRRASTRTSSPAASASGSASRARWRSTRSSSSPTSPSRRSTSRFRRRSSTSCGTCRTRTS